MRRLVIAIDCDDVLVPTAQDVVDGYNAMYGTNLKVEHVYESASIEIWGTDDDEVIKERFENYMRSRGPLSVAPFPEAITAIRELAKSHELHLVTGRSEEREDETQALLDQFFRGCFQTVEHTNHYASLKNGTRIRNKGEVCIEIGADVLIDDHIVHGQNVLDSGLKEVIVFGSYPWNQHEALPKGMRRCLDWTETLEEINRIAK